MKGENDKIVRESRILRDKVSTMSGSLELCKAELHKRCNPVELRKQLLASEKKSGLEANATKVEEIRARCEASEKKISELKGERRAQKDQMGVMRSLLMQAQSELKTRAAESAELQATLDTVRATAAANLDLAEKEKAAEIEKVLQSRLAAARSVADAELSAIRGRLEEAEAAGRRNDQEASVNNGSWSCRQHTCVLPSTPRLHCRRRV